jgi:hypothetical protein
MDTKELLIQLLLEKHGKPTEENGGLESAFIGKLCMVRTYSAGVFYGNLVAKKGKEGRIEKARRVWYWEGAASLSQLATDGTSNPTACKFPCAVESVELSEIIEVIPMTAKAITSLNAVPIWKQ